MIANITKMRGGAVTVHFGSDKVVRQTEAFPCRVWRVVRSDGVDTYREIKHITLGIREDRRVSVREAAVREAGKGWRAGATDQWVEVQPDGWQPPTVPAKQPPAVPAKPKTILRKRACP